MIKRIVMIGLMLVSVAQANLHFHQRQADQEGDRDRNGNIFIRGRWVNYNRYMGENPSFYRVPEKVVPPQIAGDNGRHEREMEKWREKQKTTISSCTDQTQMVVKMIKENEALKDESLILAEKLEEMKEAIRVLKEKADWYERYARSLHKQIGFESENFKEYK